MNKTKICLSDYFKVMLPLATVFYSLRVYEYFTSGIKLATSDSLFVIILKSLYFDTCTWLIYCAYVFIPFLLVYWINKKAGLYLLLTINVIIIAGFYGLLMVFSERSVPFDHELFIRPVSESFSTVTNVVIGRLPLVLPLFIYIVLYYALYRYIFSQSKTSTILLYIIAILSVISIFLARFTMPSIKNYRQLHEYYLVTNKLYYFMSDNCWYLLKKNYKNVNLTNKEEILKEINYYQQIHKQRYIDKEYPLLHIDESKNVLKDFFHSGDTIPNIVIIMVEGLSSDFSGENAITGSFTPFLDSLANHSLSWYNSLSVAQGTFGALPSIIGSLPYGRRGFTQLSKPTEHITLIKILKKNNWHAYYFAGGDINYDNFAGFMRLQGADFVLENFGSKYKKMGIGPEGWSAGYPDDALFNRSLEVLDVNSQKPYISIYLTLTTHTPFLFDQSVYYGKLFDKELKNRKLSDSEKHKLFYYKPMLASFLFFDDCLRHFFKVYKQRKDFKNTIFIITGDHHHGFYPTRNLIDDYNVPLIIYSSLLKKGVKFNSVNSHLNIAPTLLTYLKESYHLKYYPRYVPWLCSVLDTCVSFRNIHHVPFMLTNRNIDDYLFENYYIAGDQLFILKPGLNLLAFDNEALKSKMVQLRDNFKFINAYVCQNNKVYPSAENIYDTNATEIYSFTEKGEQNIKKDIEFLQKIDGYKPPPNYKKIMITISLLAKFESSDLNKLPRLSTSIYGNDNKEKLHWTLKKINEFINPQKNEDGWYTFSDKDIYNMENYPDPKGHVFRIEIWNQYNISMKIKDLKINFLESE